MKVRGLNPRAPEETVQQGTQCTPRAAARRAGSGQTTNMCSGLGRSWLVSTLKVMVSRDVTCSDLRSPEKRWKSQRRGGRGWCEDGGRVNGSWGR